MIIKSYEDIPYFACEAAEIRPKNKNEFSGTLVAGSGEHVVNIFRCVDGDGDIARVWAKVHLMKKIPGDIRAERAMKWAMLGRNDADWACVKMDLRDGETAFMRTWTHDYPDDAAMDEFLRQAQRFIEAHAAEFLPPKPGAANGRFTLDDLDELGGLDIEGLGLEELESLLADM